MSEEELQAEIKRLNMECAVLQTKIDISSFQYHNDVIAVEEENGRLLDQLAARQSEVQEGAEALLRTHRILSAKEAENAALREIVEAVANPNGFVRSECFLCGARTIGWTSVMEHRNDCPVTRARELLGKSSE